MHIGLNSFPLTEGPETDNEMGHRYLEVMMIFFEVSSFEGIIIEGQRMFPEKAQEIKEKAISQAKEAALRF